MIYELHLYAPKRRQLSPQMVEWMYENGQETDQPEAYWPVKKLKTKRLARYLLMLDPTLKPIQGVENDVELHYPDENIGIVLYIHQRGVVVFFPYMAYSTYSRVVLGICNTYIRFLFDAVGFWSYDPQLDLIASGHELDSLEHIARLMERLLPRQIAVPNRPGLPGNIRTS